MFLFAMIVVSGNTIDRGKQSPEWCAAGVHLVLNLEFKIVLALLNSSILIQFWTGLDESTRVIHWDSYVPLSHDSEKWNDCMQRAADTPQIFACCFCSQLLGGGGVNPRLPMGSYSTSSLAQWASRHWLASHSVG